MPKTIHWLPWLLTSAALLSSCSIMAPSNPDQDALQALREAGSDLSKPHPFDFYLYHPEHAGAAQICKQLTLEGFNTSVRDSAVLGEYLCLASNTLVPNLENLDNIQNQLSKIAQDFGGEYDGWETVVVP